MTARRFSLLLILLAAFANHQALALEPSDPLSFHGFDADAYSPDAQAGLENIFGGRLFHTAIPVKSARMMLTMMAGSAGSLGYDPQTPDGRFYAQGRFVSPDDRTLGASDEFSLGESVIQRNGQAHVTINCFLCHSGVVNGQVVAGLANNHINQSRPNQLRTRGDNFGPYAVWRLSARMEDPAKLGLVLAKETTELEELLNAQNLPPVDAMPWWLMKYKKRDYWYSDAAPDDAASFSINFTTSHDQINEFHADHVEVVSKALAFARETTSPPFPGTLDAELVRQGADIFHGRTRPANTQGFRTCKGCHGTYTKKDETADYTQPGGWEVAYNHSHIFRNVKTDPAYNTTLQALAPIAAHINKLAEYYESQGTPELIASASVPDRPGYIAPPLVGVWASAPYFHNGSVPTVEAVLNSSLRPEIWARNARDPHAYDLEHVGMQYDVVTRDDFDASAAAAAAAPFLAQAAVDHSANYDTTEYGHGNTGHTFGDNLSQQERLAVIEFLKSLSGPDM